MTVHRYIFLMLWPTLSWIIFYHIHEQSKREPKGFYTKKVVIGLAVVVPIVGALLAVAFILFLVAFRYVIRVCRLQ
jgi:hypothetical protein